MMKHKFILLFILCILIALGLRVWGLGNVPPSPDWDEAALGYNAYSILHTGRDEYGKFLPLVLRSFDDYKPGLYVYFIIPLIQLFGLSIIAVRLPSVLFGVGTVVATYFLVLEFLNREEKWQWFFEARWIALLSSFFLAISPWHIQFSRIAFESNVGVAFNVFGALAFMKGLKKPYFLLLSVSLFASNVYIYQSNKVFSPLLLLALVIIYRQVLRGISKKIIVLSVLVGVLVGFPLLFSTITNKESLARARGVSVFSDQTQFLKNNAEKIIRDKNNGDIFGMVLDNRRLEYGKAVIAGYVAHLDLNWLFVTGDLPRHHAPNMGLLYLWELPFVLVGLYMVGFGKLPKKFKFVIFSWFLLAPIPASITSGVPHAIRTLNFLPMYPIFTALGVLTSLYYVLKISNNLTKAVLLSVVVGFGILNFGYYLNQYFVQQNNIVSQEWQYGYREAIEEMQRVDARYDKVIVSNRPHLDQSYIFFLFYLKYSPQKYQKEVGMASGGFRENHLFGKYEFRPIVWEKEKKNRNILYIGRPEDFPTGVSEIKTIYFLDGKPAIKLVEG